MSAETARELQLDTACLDLGPTGLTNFYWPLARTEQQAQRDVTLEQLATLIREGTRRNDDDFQLLAMFFHWLLAESIALFRTTAVVRRAKADGFRLCLPPRSRLYGPVAESRVVDLSQGHFVRMLREGPSRHRAFLRPLVKARRALAWNGPSFRSLLPARREDVVVCHRTPLVDLHATLDSRQFRQTLFEEWFDSIKANPRAEPLRPVVVEQCLDAIRAGYAAGGEVLPDNQQQYFHRFLDGISRHVRYHYLQLQRHHQRLPRELWTGSGGYIYARMLRNAVRAAGGVVTGHEHGAGEAHIAYFSAKTLIEYESADRFFTYCWEGADALSQTFNSAWHVRDTKPEISALGERGLTDPPHQPTQERDPVSIRRIMYPTTALLGERVSLDHFVGDYVYLDWSARLVANLGQFGYKVIHKPHPGGDNRYPGGFAERFNASQMHAPFEDAQDAADAFVLDFGRSSTFPVALASNKPVIYIDFGLERWHPDARALLERRAKVVCGRIDDKNRFQVDWDELRAAIPEACRLVDRTIISRYYSHMNYGY